MMLNTMTHSFQHEHFASHARQSLQRVRRARGSTALLFSCLCMAGSAMSATDDNLDDTSASHKIAAGDWHGEWQAENTTFSLRVLPDGNRFTVEPIRPLGLEWTASNGIINGSSGSISVEYQGVTAQVVVQLISHSSAIVRSMSCQPDYHVVCTLVRNQQALFIKQQDHEALTAFP